MRWIQVWAPAAARYGSGVELAMPAATMVSRWTMYRSFEAFNKYGHLSHTTSPEFFESRKLNVDKYHEVERSIEQSDKAEAKAEFKKFKMAGSCGRETSTRDTTRTKDCHKETFEHGQESRAKLEMEHKMDYDKGTWGYLQLKAQFSFLDGNACDVVVLSERFVEMTKDWVESIFKGINRGTYRYDFIMWELAEQFGL